MFAAFLWPFHVSCAFSPLLEGSYVEFCILLILVLLFKGFSFPFAAINAEYLSVSETRSLYRIDAGGVGNGGCLVLMCSYDACTRNWRAQEKRFWKGQMKMV
jgi:hypothetical protein